MAAESLMAKTIFTEDHRKFIEALRDVRRAKAITQVQLAERLRRDQSYISNIERGQRRLDVIEFAAIAQAMDEDASALFARLIKIV